jgi:hypothetical protein
MQVQIFDIQSKSFIGKYITPGFTIAWKFKEMKSMKRIEAHQPIHQQILPRLLSMNAWVLKNKSTSKKPKFGIFLNARKFGIQTPEPRPAAMKRENKPQMNLSSLRNN